MSTASERLKSARETAGFETASAAATRYGWAQPTYLAHENGSRGYPKAKAEVYAKAFRVNIAWLISGRGQMKDGRTVPLVGIVGAGGSIIPVDDHAKGQGLADVEAPQDAGENTVAVQVRGDSMYPAYEDGDLLYYDQQPTIPDAPPAKACIVKLIDGRCMVKLVRNGSKKGRFTLLSHNAEPITDVELEWIARIKWVKKA